MTTSTRKNVFDLSPYISVEDIAKQISNKWHSLNTARQTWLEQMRELRSYVFATDTSTTSNGQSAAAFQNSTHIPKLAQIRDNLHANYMEALFPMDEFFTWEGDDQEAEAIGVRQKIVSYMLSKTRHSKFQTKAAQFVLDYIDYGNVFGAVDFIDDRTNTPEGLVPGYVGPSVVRISPEDIVFDLTASDFARTPKIIRSTYTLGALAKMARDPGNPWAEAAYKTARDNRVAVRGVSYKDLNRADAIKSDGFGTLSEYMNSGVVEVMEFRGDMYDAHTDELIENEVVIVVDHSNVVYRAQIPTWFGQGGVVHVGWRQRPDNLMSMGPLENLVGLQYRINHLENLKADIFDQYVFPVEVVTGHVATETAWGPGKRIELEEDATYNIVRPDVQALQIDLMIREIEAKMEDMAGSPRERMGMRTPGEKTAFEINVLDQGASRIFKNKTTYFEQNFLEPILNLMLEASVRNLNTGDLIRTVDSELDVVLFTNITKEDLAQTGKLRPMGARHFAADARLVQDLAQYMNSVGADPAVAVHISGEKRAQMLDRIIKSPVKFYKQNVVIDEQVVTQAQAQVAAQQLGLTNPNEGQANGNQANEDVPR